MNVDIQLYFPASPTLQCLLSVDSFALCHFELTGFHVYFPPPLNRFQKHDCKSCVPVYIYLWDIH